MHQPLVSAEAIYYPAASVEEHHGWKGALGMGWANNVNGQIAIRTAGNYAMLDLRGRSRDGVWKEARQGCRHVPSFRGGQLVHRGPRRARGEHVEKLAGDRVRRCHPEIIAAFGLVNYS